MDLEAIVTFEEGHSLHVSCRGMARDTKKEKPMSRKQRPLPGSRAESVQLIQEWQETMFTKPWPTDDLRMAFVYGAAWWEVHSSGGAMWRDDRGLAERVAEERYPNGKVKNKKEGGRHVNPIND